MVAIINSSDGSVTKISGGVHSTEQPETPVAPEPTTPQVLEPNPLAQAAHVIENLKGEEAALEKMNELMLDEAMNWFQIGGTLLQLLENKWFGGYGSFEELCWSEFGFKKSKAYHLMAIYKTLLDTDLKWADIQKLGWSKLRLLCAKAVTANLGAGDFSTYVEKAKATNMTYPELETFLKGELVGPAASKPKTLTFKPHDDQFQTIQAALDKAKLAGGTDVASVALEYICLDYISPAKMIPKKEFAANHANKVFAERLKTLGITESLNRLAEIDPAADTEEMVITFFQDTGAEHVHTLFETAFPDHDISMNASSEDAA